MYVYVFVKISGDADADRIKKYPNLVCLENRPIYFYFLFQNN